MTRLALAAVVLAALTAPAAAAPPAATLKSAEGVLDDLADLTLKGIPPALLAEAQGVAIIPDVVKAGFILGGRGGHGIVMARDKNGAWGRPVFVNLGGVSVGFQAGVEAADVVLVFRTRKSLDRLLEGKGKVTLGADAAVAAGPVGRMAAAATDGRFEAEILSYSRARGLFAGVSLDGAAIHPDSAANAAFGKDATPETRKLVDGLHERLTRMSTPPRNAKDGKDTPPPVLGPPKAPLPPLPPPERP